MNDASSTLFDGKYRIDSKLGEGGWGVVYRAYQPALQREVALKILKFTEAADDEKYRERFLREAQALSQLSHPNIVQFLHYGLANGKTPYFCTELLQGEDLGRVLAREQPSLAQVMLIAASACDALEYAHARNIIHRDIKPSNIFMTSTGIIKLIDFGLVKVLGEPDVQSQKLTMDGQRIGTPQYMSPEQAMGIKVTALSDIYSLACVLFHCLAGAPPFEADHAMVVAFQQASKALPRINDLNATVEVPERVEQTLRKALSKEPSGRFYSAGAFKAALCNEAAPAIPLPPLARQTPNIGRFRSAAVLFGLASICLLLPFLFRPDSSLCFLTRILLGVHDSVARHASVDWDDHMAALANMCYEHKYFQTGSCLITQAIKDDGHNLELPARRESLRRSLEIYARGEESWHGMAAARPIYSQLIPVLVHQMERLDTEKHYTAALPLAVEVMEICQKYFPEATEMRVSALGCLAQQYMLTKRYDAAAQIFQTILSIKGRELEVLINLAACNRRMGQLRLAEARYSQAIAWAQDEGNPLTLLELYCTLSALQWDADEKEKSRQSSDQAFALITKHNPPNEACLSWWLRHVESLRHSQEGYAQSEKHFIRSLKLDADPTHRVEQANIFSVLALICQRSGRHQDAEQYRARAASLSSASLAESLSSRR